MADPSSAPDAHVSVLAAEVVQALAPPLAATADSILVDATTGLGGHTRRLLEAANPGLVVLLDRDTDALSLAKERLTPAPCPLRFVHAPFSAIASELAAINVETVTAIVADLGVSSIQLDRVERGFSFRGDATLDMRMDPSRGETAADVLADIQVPELTSILSRYGDEPDARRIAAAIVKVRPTTTAALAGVVTNAMTGRQRRKLGLRIHPATRTFQALRIHVNDELGELERLLADAPSLLDVGGRLGIITFHSLEDRRVKHRFRELSTPPQLPPHLPIPESERPRPKFSLPSQFTRGATPTPAELDANPRSRSARLRVIQRDLP